jgi:hypothetical protein
MWDFSEHWVHATHGYLCHIALSEASGHRRCSTSAKPVSAIARITSALDVLWSRENRRD